jgi:hypothetical protein
VAAIGDGQALDLMKPLNASVADTKPATKSHVGKAGSQEGERREQLSILSSARIARSGNGVRACVAVVRAGYRRAA